MYSFIHNKLIRQLQRSPAHKFRNTNVAHSNVSSVLQVEVLYAISEQISPFSDVTFRITHGIEDSGNNKGYNKQIFTIKLNHKAYGKISQTAARFQEIELKTQ